MDQETANLTNAWAQVNIWTSQVQHLPPLQYNSPSTDAKQSIVFSFKSCRFDNMIYPNANNIQLQMIWKVEQSHAAAGYFGIVYPMMWRMTSKTWESAASVNRSIWNERRYQIHTFCFTMLTMFVFQMWFSDSIACKWDAVQKLTLKFQLSEVYTHRQPHGPIFESESEELKDKVEFGQKLIFCQVLPLFQNLRSIYEL